MKFKAEGKQRKERSDKKIRVCPYVEKSLHKKLHNLSYTCGLSPTELMLYITDLALNDEKFITWVQDKFHVEKEDRIIPIRDNNKLIY